MTDNEIIKAANDCDSCVVFTVVDWDKNEHIDITLADLVGILNRQQAEIEKLNIELQAMRGAANSYKAEIERLQKNLEEAHIDIKEHLAEIENLKKLVVEKHNKNNELHKYLQYVKAEAVKEFAERLREKGCELEETGGFLLDEDDIDNLVKEMVGEK